MQLKLQRSQRQGGMLGNTAIFCLDARAQLTPEEEKSVARYDLGHLIIYSSEAAKKTLERRDTAIEASRSWDAKTSAGGMAKGLGLNVLALFQLNISIDSLKRGQHIECKSLDEVLGAEQALMDACENMKSYLDTAGTFDGREVIIDFSSGKPEVVAASSSPDPMLIAPGMAPEPHPPRPGKVRPLLLGSEEPAPASPAFDDRFGYGGPDPNQMDRSAAIGSTGLPPPMKPLEPLPDDDAPIVAPIRITKKRSPGNFYES